MKNLLLIVITFFLSNFTDAQNFISKQIDYQPFNPLFMGPTKSVVFNENIVVSTQEPGISPTYLSFINKALDSISSYTLSGVNLNDVYRVEDLEVLNDSLLLIAAIVEDLNDRHVSVKCLNTLGALNWEYSFGEASNNNFRSVQIAKVNEDEFLLFYANDTSLVLTHLDNEANVLLSKSYMVANIGVVGDIVIDSSNIYLCTQSNSSDEKSILKLDLNGNILEQKSMEVNGLFDQAIVLGNSLVVSISQHENTHEGKGVYVFDVANLSISRAMNSESNVSDFLETSNLYTYTDSSFIYSDKHGIYEFDTLLNELNYKPLMANSGVLMLDSISVCALQFGGAGSKSGYLNYVLQKDSSLFSNNIEAYNGCNIGPQTFEDFAFTPVNASNFSGANLALSTAVITTISNPETTQLSFGCPFIGVEEVQISPSFLLYPNPTSQSVNLEIDTSVESVKLVDLQGKVLRNYLSNVSTIELSGINAGYYFVLVTLEDGSQLRKSFVKR